MYTVGMFISLFLMAGGVASASDTFQGQTFYYGDIHLQTGASLDAGSSDIAGTCTLGDCGAVTDIVSTARAAGLDFMAVTDHINGPNAGPGAVATYVMQEVLSGHVDEEFVVIPGAELCCWTEDLTADNPGHRNVYLFSDDLDYTTLTRDDLLPVNEDGSEVDGCDEIWPWMSRLQSTWGDALLIPHHTTKSGAVVNWSCFDEAWTPTVEVYSYHGNNMGDEDYEPLIDATDSGNVMNALDPDGHNHKMGFIGSGDFHDTRPGQVCGTDAERDHILFGSGVAVAVLDQSETFNRQALYRAFTERHTYATSGPMLPVKTTISDAVSRSDALGAEVVLYPGQYKQLAVSVPIEHLSAITRVFLVFPGGQRQLTQTGNAWQAFIRADDLPEWAYFRLHIDGQTHFGGDCDDGGEDDTDRIWTSPTWFTLAETDTGAPD